MAHYPLFLVVRQLVHHSLVLGYLFGTSLAAVGCIFGITSVVTGVFVKPMASKLEKHQKTVSVCSSKTNTIKDIVSKPLNDNKISDEELKLVSEDIRKYSDMKISIRYKFKKREPEKNSTCRCRKIEARNETRASKKIR